MYQLSSINVKRSYIFTLCLVAFTLPLSVTYNSLSFILLALVWIAEGRWERKWELARSNYWVPLFCLYFIWHVAGLAYTHNIIEGLHELEKKAPLLLFPLVLGTATIKYSGLTIKVIWAFVVANFIAAAVCIVDGFDRYWKGIPPNSSVYGGHDATVKFREAHKGVSAIWDYITYTELTVPVKIHPTYFSLYILFSILFLCYILFKNYRKQEQVIWKNVGYLLLIFFFSTFIFLLSSRIAIVIFMLFIASSPLLIWKLSKLKILSLVTIFALLTSILAAQVPVVQHRFLNDLKMLSEGTMADNPGTGMYQRINVWITSITLIKENPLTGVGTGDAQIAFDAEYERQSLQLHGLNAHNQFLQTAITLGLPAMLLLLLLFIIPFKLAFRSGNILFVYYLLIVFTASLTEAILQRHKGIVFYALFNSLFLFYNYTSGIEESTKGELQPKSE